MIVDKGGSAVDGVKPIVMETFDFPATRSEGLIVNDGDVMKEAPEPKIGPESTANDGRTSCDVCTVQRDPAVILPIVKPEIVTVNNPAGI